MPEHHGMTLPYGRPLVRRGHEHAENDLFELPHINAVCPRSKRRMVTDMIDIGRLSVPDALANQRLAC
jgi:hypothetical protein